MKTLKPFSGLFIATLIVLAAFSIAPQKAEAADPLCYFNVTGPVADTEASDGVARPGVARTISCADPEMTQHLNIPVINLTAPGGPTTISAFKPDHCYVLAEFQVLELPPDNGSLTCAGLAEWAAVTAATPTKCFTYDAENLKKFVLKEYNPASLAETGCDDAFKEAYRDKFSADLPTGVCIVADSDKNDFLTQRCADVEGSKATAQENLEEAARSITQGRCDITETEATCSVNKDQVITDCAPGDKCDFMAKFVNPVIRFLSIGVGFIIVVMVIASGIRYASAGSDPQKATAARKMALNAVLALVTYLFFYAILVWLLPKGIEGL